MSALFAGLSLFFSIACPVFSKPGNEQVLRSHTTTTTLYLSALIRDGSGEIHATFTWLPADIEEECLGNSYKQCRVRDHCRTYPISQKCEKDLSHCRPVVDADCVRLGVTVANFKRRPTDAVPFGILQGRVPAGTDGLLGQLQAWAIPLGFKGQYEPSTLDRKYAIRAKVKWEQWTNGENFSILKLLKPQR